MCVTVKRGVSKGGRIGCGAVRTSLPQIPVASTLINTSSSPTGGRGTSRISMVNAFRRTQDLFVVIVIVSWRCTWDGSRKLFNWGSLRTVIVCAVLFIASGGEGARYGFLQFLPRISSDGADKPVSDRDGLVREARCITDRRSRHSRGIPLIPTVSLRRERLSSRDLIDNEGASIASERGDPVKVADQEPAPLSCLMAIHVLDPSDQMKKKRRHRSFVGTPNGLKESLL